MRCLRWIAIACAAMAISPSAAFAAPGDWRLGFFDPMDSPNPIVQQTNTGIGLAGMSYDFLLNYAIGDLEPDTRTSLANAYEVSEDGLTWTFKLNDGIEWSDGRPFTSADVKWTYDQVLNAPASPLGLALMGVREVRAPDALTVVIEMDEPNGSIPSAFVPILPKHVWSKLSKKQIQQGRGPIPNVTTGPFVLTKFDPRGDTILEANPRYRHGVPKAKRLVWIKYGDQAGQLRDLRLRQIDAVFAGKPEWARQLRNQTAIKVWSADAPQLTMIAFNSCPPEGVGACERPGPNANIEVVQDPAIRQALNAAIDRRQIVDTVFAGQATPGLTGIIPPYYRRYAPPPEGSDRPDLEAAKKALADGGWDCAQNPCVKDGVKAEFKLLYDPAKGTAAGLAQRVRAQAAAVNINVELDPLSLDAQAGKINAPGSKEGTFRPDYDAAVSSWGGVPGAPDGLMSILHTTGPFPEVYYSNPEYDRLLDQAQSTIDADERADLLQQANRIGQRDLPYIVVLNARAVALTQNETWHGYQPSPSGNGRPWGNSPAQLAGIAPGPAAGSPSADDGGGSTGVIVAIVAAVALLGVGALLLLRRRRGGSDTDAGWTEA
jgi:peptide/nickel transport system substrate-binding protein